MAHKIYFEAFLDNVIGNCERILAWMGEKTGIAGELHDNFNDHYEKMHSMVFSAKGAAIDTKRGIIGKAAFLEYIEDLGKARSVGNWEMPQRIVSMTYDLKKMVVCGTKDMWKQCEVIDLVTNASWDIRKMINFLWYNIEHNIFSGEKMLDAAKKLTALLKERLVDAGIIKDYLTKRDYLAESDLEHHNNEIVGKISLNLKNFGGPCGNSRNYFDDYVILRNYIMDIREHSTTGFPDLFLFAKLNRVFRWYESAAAAFEYQRGNVHIDNYEPNNAIEIDASAANYLSDAYRALRKIPKILRDNVIPPSKTSANGACDANAIRVELIDDISETLPIMRLIIGADFCFPANRDMFRRLTKRTIDNDGRCLETIHALTEIWRLTNEGYKPYNELIQLAKKMDAYLRQADIQVKKLQSN